MPTTRHSYHNRDYTFGQTMLKLRSSIGLTQAGLANLLEVSRRAVGEWESGSSYPKGSHMQHLLALCVQQHVFEPGREEEEIRALWKMAHQRVLLDEPWLAALLGGPTAVAAPVAEAGETAVVAAPVTEAGEIAVVKASPAPAQLSPETEMPVASTLAGPAASPHVDWVGALDVSHFTGREVEVAELTQWIVQERCRMVMLLGIGGIGKSTLASFLGVRLASQFEAVLWRSVRDAPSCEELVADCITFFSETPPATFPTSLEQRINLLVARLQTRRCLLVLDNLETLLASGDPEGNYLPGYNGYGRLIQRLAESAHQSCVLLTSREKPREIEPLEGARGPVRSLRLEGLDEQAAHTLLDDRGLNGTSAAWQRLVAGYAGNPLALKIVAQAVFDLFDGDIDRFLQEGELVFNGVRPVLRQQVGRLTPLELLLLNWLTVMREWTPLDTLAQALHPRALRARLLEALEALRRRSLLEQQRANFSLQSVVMEYLTDALGERLAEEIVQGNPQHLRHVALEQAQAKDYVRQTQVRLLVHPLVERLRSELGADALVETYLLRLLEQFRAEDAAVQGYGPANVITLLKDLRGHLRGLDLSRLALRGAYLQGIEMQDATLAGAMLHEVVFTEAFDAILSVAVSPDGRYFAAGSSSGQVRVWREEGHVAHLTMQGHTDRVTSIAFSPDGRALATAGYDGVVKLWDVESGAMMWMGQNTNVPIISIAIGPSGKLVSGGLDGAMYFWDLRTGAPLSRLQTQDGRLLALAWSADGHWLASGGIDSVIRLWDAEQGKLLQELPGHRGWVSALAFAPGPDSSLLASGSFDYAVKLWNAETGACLKTLEGHTNPVVGLAWAPDGRVLASASHDTTIRLWDSQSGRCRHILPSHHQPVISVTFLPTGDRLLSGGYDRTVRIWDVQSGQNVYTLQGYAFTLYGLAWSPEGQFFVTASSEATLRLWNVTSRTLVQVLYGHEKHVQTVAWSRATHRIASGSEDHTVRLWDVQAGVCTHILQGHTGNISSVDWSADGSSLASGGYDGCVHIWDMPQGNSRVNIEQAGVVNAVAWSPDGMLLANANEEGLVLVWRAADGELLRRFEHAGIVGDLRWNHDGKQLVSGSANGEQGVLSIWDVQQGTRARTLEGHRGFVMGVDWSLQDNILVSAGADGTVRWWDPEQGVHLETIQAHNAWARAVRISPDGKTVASCGEDGTIGLWDMQSHQHLATLQADRPYERLDISGTLGLTNAQKAALQALGASSAATATPPLF